MSEPRTDTTTRSLIEEVYRRDGARMWRALMLYTRDREITSDALAEAFAQALARGDALRTPDRWIWKVAFRVADAQIKSRRKDAVAAEPSAGIDDESRELAEALEQLSPRQRASIVLHYIGGYRQREIAALIGSTTAAVGVHLHRGRARLRTLLENNDG